MCRTDLRHPPGATTGDRRVDERIRVREEGSVAAEQPAGANHRVPRDVPFEASTAALFVDAEGCLDLSAPEESQRIAHARIQPRRSDVRVIEVGIQMLIVVVDLQPVRTLRPEGIERAARIRVGGLDRDRAPG